MVWPDPKHFQINANSFLKAFFKINKYVLIYAPNVLLSCLRMVKYFRAFVGRFSKQGRRYVISFRLIACVVQTCLTRPQGPLQNHINMLNNYEHWNLITRAVAVPQPTQSMLRVTQSQRGFLFSGPDAILNRGPIWKDCDEWCHTNQHYTCGELLFSHKKTFNFAM